jgi:hypothetical protein
MDKVRFNYLYRDAGNYKRWSKVVFPNPDGMPLDAIAESLRAAFLSDGLFIAHQVRIPEVFFSEEGESTSDDHCFHEFDSVELYLESSSDVDSRSIAQFIAEVKQQAKGGWKAFDPRDRSVQSEGPWTF